MIAVRAEVALRTGRQKDEQDRTKVDRKIRDATPTYLDDVHNIVGNFIQFLGMVVEMVQLSLLCKSEYSMGPRTNGLKAQKLFDFAIHDGERILCKLTLVVEQVSNEDGKDKGLKQMGMRCLY